MRRLPRLFAPRRLARALAVCALVGSLAGCPEERPGAQREISPQKFPPAMPVEQQPAAPARRPDAAATAPAEARTRAADATAHPSPDRSDAKP